jgi:uncharacterized protein (DUF697 family)
MNRKAKAGAIIHSLAAAAATWSTLTTLFFPLVGPALGDTVGLTAITVAMTHSLANLFGKKIEKDALISFSSVIMGAILGTSLLKTFASLVPVLGSGVNAVITFGLHEAIGWALYTIFEESKDPTEMSKKELQSYIKRGRSIAEEERKRYEQMLENLPLDARTEVEQLQKKLADKNLSIEDRDVILGKITEIIANYNQLEDDSSIEDKETLHRVLCHAFNIQELRVLSFNLEIDYDHIEGETIDSQAAKIIDHCIENKKLRDLVAYISEVRPTWVEGVYR